MKNIKKIVSLISATAILSSTAFAATGDFYLKNGDKFGTADEVLFNIGGKGDSVLFGGTGKYLYEVDGALYTLEDANKAYAADKTNFKQILKSDYEAVPDLSELKVESVSAINGKTIVVKFTKPVKKSTVLTTSSNVDYVKNINFRSLESPAKNITISGVVSGTDATGELSEDGKTLTIKPAGNEVVSGRYDVTIIAGSIQATTNEYIGKFESSLEFKDTVAPTIIKNEKVSATTYKVTFSEPLQSIGTLSYKVGTKDIATSGNGVVATFTPGNDYVEFSIGTDVDAGQEVVATFVGAKDYANNLVSPNPTTVNLVKGSKDGVAPTVASITPVSGKALELKFSEELSAKPTVTVAGSVISATDIIQDKIDKTKYKVSLSSALTGLQTVSIAAGYSDLSGEAGLAYTKAINFSVDTTAPKLLSSSIEVQADKSEALVLTFDENVEKPVGLTTIAVTGTATKDFITTSTLPNASIAASTLVVDTDNKKVARIKLADLVGSVAANEGTVYDLTLTGDAAIVQDESGNAGSLTAKAKFTRGKDGSAQTATQATVKTSVSGNGITVVNNNELTVTFNGELDGATATNPSNYIVSGAIVESASLNASTGSGANLQQTVTLKLKENSLAANGERAITINNVKAKNGVAMETYNTTESLSENVLPTLQSAEITEVTQANAGSAAVPASAAKSGANASIVTLSNQTSATETASETFTIQTNGEVHNAAGVSQVTLSGETGSYSGNFTYKGVGVAIAAGSNNDTFTVATTAGVALVPAVTAETKVTLTFSEIVKLGTASNLVFDVKSGQDVLSGVAGTIASANSSNNTKTLVVTIDAAITAAQKNAGISLVRASANTVKIIDVNGNEYEVPSTGIQVAK